MMLEVKKKKLIDFHRLRRDELDTVDQLKNELMQQKEKKKQQMIE